MSGHCSYHHGLCCDFFGVPLSLLRDYPPAFCARVLRLRKQLLKGNPSLSGEPSLRLDSSPPSIPKFNQPLFAVCHGASTRFRCSLTSPCLSWCRPCQRTGQRMQCCRTATTMLGDPDMFISPKSGSMFLSRDGIASACGE